MELGVVNIVAQGEDLESLQHSHYGGVSVGFNGSGDKFLDIVPKVAVALVYGQLDHVGRRLGNLVHLAANEGDTGGFFRAHRQELGDGDLEGVGDDLDLGDGGIALYAGEEVAGAGAHPVGHVSQGEALLAADCFEVSFYRIHIGHISLKQRYGFVDRLTNLFYCLLVE